MIQANQLISDEEIARAIRKETVIIDGDHYKIAGYLSGGEATTFELVNGANSYWLKAFKNIDAVRSKRYAHLESFNVLPFKIQYIPDAGSCFPKLAPKFLKRLHDAALAENVPYPSWAEILEDGGVQDRGYDVARSLATKIKELETNDISHRDASHHNILINKKNAQVALIDWDQCFASGVPAPKFIKSGTPGYQPSFPVNYEPKGDRFALAILIMEFISVQTCFNDFPFFKPYEILECQASEKMADEILDKKQIFMGNGDHELRKLALKTLTAGSFAEMASPDEWLEVLNKKQEKKQVPIIQRKRFSVVRIKRNDDFFLPKNVCVSEKQATTSSQSPFVSWIIQNWLKVVNTK